MASFAAAGPDRFAELLAGLRVHPVLTAHPTEARRRAVAAALRRIAALVEALDDQPAGAADQAEVRRRLREEIGLLWRTAPLRVKPMGPVDEVRTVMAVFDETLFSLGPRVYRALDRAAGPDAADRAAGARRSCGSAAGWARTGTATRP